MRTTKEYKIDHLANWYYGNICIKCARIDVDGGREGYDKLHSAKKELPSETTHKEYVSHIKNKTGICNPTPRTFPECRICKALGIPTYRG